MSIANEVNVYRAINHDRLNPEPFEDQLDGVLFACNLPPGRYTVIGPNFKTIVVRVDDPEREVPAFTETKKPSQLARIRSPWPKPPFYRVAS